MASSSPTAMERFLNGIIPENPVYRQMLGMCPVLAVTGAMKPALTMAAATAFVLISANVMISLIRGLLKPHLRILVFTLTIATFVTVADRFLAAYLYTMSKQLGPYVPLIIVNCLIISRCEICSSKQSVGVALADGLGMSLGFALGLASIATVREVLGSGTWFGLTVLPSVWPAWGIMILPPGAFLVLGLLLGLVEWIGQRRAASP
ncbi:MAG: electron transport complex subunit RsxE [Pirellulaceae bacterium]|nr:electron transport complex subunit RsxE [Pirellulaceae bacterium]